MSEEPKMNEDLKMTDDNSGANMPGDGTDSGSAAGMEPAEDTLDAYKTLAKELADQNKVLMENQKNLQDQISVLIRNGASINDSSVNDNNLSGGNGSGAPSSEEAYVSLAELGTELGKRDYKNENMKE